MAGDRSSSRASIPSISSPLLSPSAEFFFYFTYHTSLCSMVTAHTFYSPLEVLYPLLCGGHCLPLNIFITGFFSVKSISGSTRSKFLLTPFFPEKMYYCPASLKMYAFSSENWVFKYYVRVILIFIGVF